VRYTLKNESPGGLRLRFASEWAFNLLAGDAHDRYYESNGKKLEDPKMNSTGSSPQPSNFRLVDEFLQLAIDLKPEGAHEVIRYPLESVSLSEAGFERIFQGSIVMPVWEIAIQPGAEWHTRLVVAFELLS
jgi:alpha-amylase